MNSDKRNNDKQMLVDAVKILRDLRGGCTENCFCDFGIGDPRMSDHDEACQRALDFLEKFDARS